MGGFIKNLPSLNVGRQYHACASYENGEEKVEFFLIKSDISIIILDILGGGWLRRYSELTFYRDSHSGRLGLGHSGGTTQGEKWIESNECQ